MIFGLELILWLAILAISIYLSFGLWLALGEIDPEASDSETLFPFLMITFLGVPMKIYLYIDEKRYDRAIRKTQS